jgi:membrane protein DedA with SNARE-associated domain
MDAAQLVQEYGYVAVGVGAFLEGETVLLLGAVSAQLGYLELPIVAMVAAVAAFLGDNVYFFAGRRYGRRLMQRFPPLAAAVPRVDRFVGRWHALAVVLLRFTYGLRIAGPIVLGAGRMKTSVFVSANAVGAILWAIIFSAIGYASGHAARRLLGGVARIEHIAIGLVITLLLLTAIAHFIMKRRLARTADKVGE